jgi:hypothetical protein
MILDLDELPVELGRAMIWKAKDGDCAVTIAGDLGVGPDGRRYVSVENSSTGIPLDELEI